MKDWGKYEDNNMKELWKINEEHEVNMKKEENVKKYEDNMKKYEENKYEEIWRNYSPHT
mgnify:CR=1 FL=1